MSTTSKEPSQADHLCVLMHGLWGNPDHLKYLVDTLQEHHGKDKIMTLVCKSNAGNFTYDGIDVGAERAAKEIKEFLKEMDDQGRNITKFSIVGYSLGGLVARYAIGVLDHDGFFETMQPVNFTTFASPHLGTRTPLKLWTSQVFNAFGPRVISASGQQLFVMDKFRDTGKPLLEVMTEPESIFVHALAKFQKRTLYANIVNDRLAAFYTTSISPIDPYAGDLDKLKVNYVKGYHPVVINGQDPVQGAESLEVSQISPPSFVSTASTSVRKVATFGALLVFMPIFATGFLATSVVETWRSQRRIRTHSLEEDGLNNYRVTNMLQRVASRVERTSSFSGGATSNGQPRSPLSRRNTASTLPDTPETPEHTNGTPIDPITSSSLAKTTSRSPQPTEERLALLDSQFKMIESLDKVGFEKFHVWIHDSNWSHAAIIVRRATSMFDEGKIVVKHWIEQQFQI